MTQIFGQFPTQLTGPVRLAGHEFALFGNSLYGNLCIEDCRNKRQHHQQVAQEDQA